MRIYYLLSQQIYIAKKYIFYLTKRYEFFAECQFRPKGIFVECYRAYHQRDTT